MNENIKNTVRVFPMQGRMDYLRYDMNENPEGLPENFVEMVKKEITPEFLATYPEPDRFLHKYARYTGVEFDNVLAVNGSDMAIRYLLEAFGERGKEVVTVTPSFEMYWVNCNILGYNHVPVAYNSDFTMDINNILAVINDNTRVVVLINPNNPVGNVYSESEVEQVIKKADSVGAIVIIDEAYYYFFDGTFLDLVKRYSNVVVLRTFSKLFSLAACRLGVIVGAKDLIRCVRNIKLTFDANSIALLFAERLLDHPEIEQVLIEEEKEGKQYILKALRQRGYECRDCMGNFIFVKTRKTPELVSKELKDKHKVLVKRYTNELLKEYIRVSVGSKRAMERFLSYYFAVDS